MDGKVNNRVGGERWRVSFIRFRLRERIAVGEHAREKSAMINCCFVLRREKIITEGARPPFVLQQRYARARLTPTVTDQYDLRGPAPIVYARNVRRTRAVTARRRIDWLKPFILIQYFYFVVVLESSLCDGNL